MLYFVDLERDSIIVSLDFKFLQNSTKKNMQLVDWNAVLISNFEDESKCSSLESS